MYINLNNLFTYIKFNSLYICVDCGKRAVGDTVNEEFSCHSTEELKSFIDNQRQISTYMPDGWSYNNTFHCNECTSINSL